MKKNIYSSESTKKNNNLIIIKWWNISFIKLFKLLLHFFPIQTNLTNWHSSWLILGGNLRNRTCIQDQTNIQEKRNLIIIKQVVKYFFHKVKFLLHFIFFSVRTNLNNWRSSWLGWTCYFCATNNNNTLRLCLSNLFAVFKSERSVNLEYYLQASLSSSVIRFIEK